MRYGVRDAVGIGRAQQREQILLTGATGYIGGRLLRRLEDEVTSRSTGSRRSRPAPYAPRKLVATSAAGHRE